MFFWYCSNLPKTSSGEIDLYIESPFNQEISVDVDVAPRTIVPVSTSLEIVSLSDDMETSDDNSLMSSLPHPPGRLSRSKVCRSSPARAVRFSVPKDISGFYKY